jgi:hypothetical protein
LATKDDINDAPLFKGAAKMEVVKIVVLVLKESIFSDNLADLIIEKCLVILFG